jgi:predicted deacylase
MDANRAYPGKSLANSMHVHGHTENLVHELYTHMTRYSDCVLDCHDGGSSAWMASYADYYVGPPEVEQRSRDLAIASGMRIIWKTSADFVRDKYPGSLKTYLTERGIPGLTLEVGGRGQLPTADVERMQLSFFNVMRHLGMLDGEVIIPEEQVFILNGNWLRPVYGGVWWQKVEAGQYVKKSDVIGIVTDLFGREKEQVLAPIDGIVVGIRLLSNIHTGEYAGNVGEIDRTL